MIFRLIFPEYARDKIIAAQADFASNLAQTLKKFLDIQCSLKEYKQIFTTCEKNLVADIASFNRYIDEAVMEVRKVPFIIDIHHQSMEHLKHIYHLLSTFFYSYMTTEDNKNNRIIRQIMQDIMDNLFAYCGAMNNPTQSFTLQPILPVDGKNIQSLFAMMDALVIGLNSELQGLADNLKIISHIRLTHYKGEDLPC